MRYRLSRDRPFVRHPPRFFLSHRHWPRHRLYLQIFFGFLKVLLVLGLMIGALFWHYAGNRWHAADEQVLTLLQTLFPVTATPAETESVMRAINGISGGSVALYAADGRLLHAVGTAAPRLEQAIRPHESGPPFHPAMLPDGRKLVLEWDQNGPSKHFGWIVLFLLLAALGSYPISRRLTRRIEALQMQADAWGEGNLSARAQVQGYDEIAELATRFNQAAERIELLLGSQRAMLAAASHELRSPLARLRLAVASNIRFKLAALAIAAAIWGIALYTAGTTVRTVTVPVVFSHVPAGMRITSQSSSDVDVQLSGNPVSMGSASLARVAAGVGHVNVQGESGGPARQVRVHRGHAGVRPDLPGRRAQAVRGPVLRRIGFDPIGRRVDGGFRRGRGAVALSVSHRQPPALRAGPGTKILRPHGAGEAVDERQLWVRAQRWLADA